MRKGGGKGGRKEGGERKAGASPGRKALPRRRTSPNAIKLCKIENCEEWTGRGAGLVLGAGEEALEELDLLGLGHELLRHAGLERTLRMEKLKDFKKNEVLKSPGRVRMSRNRPSSHVALSLRALRCVVPSTPLPLSPSRPPQPALPRVLHST